jgi:Flp pilus assembly protein TadD
MAQGVRLLLAASGLALLPLAPAHGTDGSTPTPPPEVEQKDASPYQAALHHYQSGAYQEALTSILEEEKLLPDDPSTQVLKARILTELLRFEDARKTLAALNSNPKMTPDLHTVQAMAQGDLSLRRHDFNGAAKIYESLLAAHPKDPDLMLHQIYAQIGIGNNPAAEKLASKLKPMDSATPAYYFARAALAQATGDTNQADTDIQTVRTMYGISVSNQYLKTYLEVTARTAPADASAKAPAPAAPAPAK